MEAGAKMTAWGAAGSEKVPDYVKKDLGIV